MEAVNCIHMFNLSITQWWLFSTSRHCVVEVNDVDQYFHKRASHEL